MKRTIDEVSPMRDDLNKFHTDLKYAKKVINNNSNTALGVRIIQGVIAALKQTVASDLNDLAARELLSLAYNELGHYFSSIKNTANAISNFEDAILNAKRMMQIDPDNASARSLIVAASFAMTPYCNYSQDSDKILDYVKDAVSFQQWLISHNGTNSSKVSLALLYTNIAHIYRFKKDAEQVMNYRKLSIDVFEEVYRADSNFRQNFAKPFSTALSTFAQKLPASDARVVALLTHPVHILNYGNIAEHNSMLLELVTNEVQSNAQAVHEIEDFFLSQRVLSFSSVINDQQAVFINNVMSVATRVYRLHFGFSFNKESAIHFNDAAKEWKSCCITTWGDQMFYTNPTFNKINQSLNYLPTCTTLQEGIKKELLPAAMYQSIFCNSGGALNLLNVISFCNLFRRDNFIMHARTSEYAEEILGSVAVVPLILCLSRGLNDDIHLPAEVVEIIAHYLTPDTRTELAHHYG